MLDLPQVTVTAVALGTAVFVAGALVAWLARLATTGFLTWRGRSPSAATVFGGLVQVILTTVSLGAALTIIFPSVKPVDVLGGVGIVSIAAGIAFQTVLGNMFAGMVILGRDRFRVGDQIRVGEHQGTVASMGLSSTSLRTFDGRLVIVPNSALHSQAVTVQTGYEKVRTAVRLDVDEAADLRLACRTAVNAMNGLPQVSADPPPEALLSSIGMGTVQLELRFWSGALQLETREAQHAVILRVLDAFRAAGVATGSDVHVVEAGPLLADRLGGRTGDDDDRDGPAETQGPWGSRARS